MTRRSKIAQLLLISMWCCGPYFWLVWTAFRRRLDITSSPPVFDARLTLSNFSLEYNGQSLFGLLFNTLVISLATVTLSLLIRRPASYYFARHQSRWARRLFLFVLSTRMAPPIALSMPMFVVFAEVNLLGTYASVIIAHSIFNIAFVVWFMEGIFVSVPDGIEKAAQVDGRTRIGALIDVVLPLVRPALVTTAAFVFLFSWNEYLMASLLTSPNTRPVTPALPGFLAQATSQWGAFCAVALVASLPAISMAFVGRRFLAKVFAFGPTIDAQRERWS